VHINLLCMLAQLVAKLALVVRNERLFASSGSGGRFVDREVVFRR
jgi:hypothetical protein